MSPEHPQNDPGRPDIIVSGPRLEDRVPPSWRKRIVVAAVFVVGVALGGYGATIVLNPAEPTGDPVTANQSIVLSSEITRLSALALPYPPYRIKAVVHNRGATSVEVEDTRLRIRGFDVVLEAGDRRRIPPGGEFSLFYGARPTCGETPTGDDARLTVRVRLPSGESVAVTTRASTAGSGIADGHAIVCSKSPPELRLAAETVAVDSKSGSGLTVALDMAATGGDDRSDLRLLDVDLEAPWLDLEPGQIRGSARMPARVSLQLNAVTNCAAATRKVGAPTSLAVALTSPEGPHFLYAHTDAAFAQAVRAFVAAECGGAR